MAGAGDILGTPGKLQGQDGLGVHFGCPRSQDVYAHDTLAWALCKKGQYKDAVEAMDEALKLGTKDASLFYHAGMIQAGLGNKDKARDWLKKSLDLNSHFSLLQADKARKYEAQA